MEKSEKLGMNLTGAQMSPKDTQAILAYTRERLPTSQGDGTEIAALRASCIREEQGSLGTVPVPGTVKGVLKSGAKMLKGERPQALADKLGERVSFERSGVRLYDAMITKYHATNGGVPHVSLEKLMEIRDEEAQHFAMLVEAVQSLGADPTAETPSADLTGVETQGLLNVITDPRTTFAQSLHALLIAELADNDGWDMLITIAEAEGQKDMAERFRMAYEQEQDHLDHVRRWLMALQMDEVRVGKPS